MLDMMTSGGVDGGGRNSFIDDLSGNNYYVDGLMCCTESLGFESSDERRVVDDRLIHQSLNRIDDEFFCSRKLSAAAAAKKEDHHQKINKFPPPLSSLTQDGRPTFFLRPIRRDGRLMLTEVKIARPEILRASRQDGRLKLHLVLDTDEDDDNNDNDNDDDEEEQEEQEEDEDDVEIMQDNDQEYIKEKEGWQFSGATASGGAGDGLRRCHEQVISHRDQNVWRQHQQQHCLTIR